MNSTSAGFGVRSMGFGFDPLIVGLGYAIEAKRGGNGKKHKRG